MVNFGLLAAEIHPVVWGTPANFNGFRVLAALLHGSRVVSVSHTAAFNRGRHLCSAGRPSRWALAHILVDTRTMYPVATCRQSRYVRNPAIVKLLLQCYLFTVSNSGLLSVQRPLPASHAHFRHSPTLVFLMIVLILAT